MNGSSSANHDPVVFRSTEDSIAAARQAPNSDAGQSETTSTTASGRSPRLPFFYPNSENESRSALSLRYRYYNRLDPSGLRMPDHVVPPSFFAVSPFQDDTKKQGSIVTIFSIWNTMVGASLLSLPWALSQAGFVLGIICIILMASIAYYTALRIVQSPSLIDAEDKPAYMEFTDVCRYYFGRWGEYIALGFSFISLLSGAIVYWVLMCNFLYNTGNVIYESLQTNASEQMHLRNDTLRCDVYCLSVQNVTDKPSDAYFYRVWSLDHTVPFFLIILVFPLINFQSPTFFTKFNGLGTISILYLLSFVVVKIMQCGWHVNLSDKSSIHYSTSWSATFPVFTGTLSLSFFIHNIIISIMRNQKCPENNARDLSCAYILVTLTYSVIAIGFYAAFPTLKSCISDNLLNNFAAGDLLSSVARVFLLFQMTTVFPLLLYLLRIQLLSPLFGSAYPSCRHVLGFNLVSVAICVLFAVFLPHIGHIIRFAGALCGVAYMFALPCLVYMYSLYRRGQLRWYTATIHTTIIVLGVANFIAQFAIV